MHTHTLTTQILNKFNDLIDEEFDELDSRPSFNRKPLRAQMPLLGDDSAWTDSFDNMDMLCELQE